MAMIFPAALDVLFSFRGETCVYTPISGPPLTLRAIRTGGGQQFNYGSVVIWLERTRFEVLRSELPSPVVGATLEVAGNTWTIQGIQPCYNDAYALKWSLDVSWGATVTWRSVSGQGATQSPPSITGALTLAAAALAGASAVSVRCTYAVGKLVPGDVLTIGGADHTVTTTTQAASNVFSAVGITPALATGAAMGAAVSAQFSRDTEITAAISGYTARELQGGLQAGDLRIILLPAAANALSEAPKIGDLVVASFGTLRVVNASPVYAGSSIAAYEIQCRK